MPATSLHLPGPVSRRNAVVEDLAAARALRSEPITVIRRTPHPPMRGDDRPARRLSRAVSSLGQGAR
ncbi:hypothetical protein GCM10011519_07880 [Marmoricola endophyticus]|uniref:Uncharacterized protein n=1 Tax=Marmoricola endophyticus TaxID=2040280 RepID=A0A917BF07_9ACTN|nr:hypothetical protein [Marmoricola endophyticus]GGF36759.1 hypothetical protein GCM10011519_07880 [Marmoricola endophyticus]